jgi:hypothetical protein
MIMELFTKVIIELFAKIIADLLGVQIIKKKKPAQLLWDENVGDYVAGVEQKATNVKSDVDINKWYNPG